MLPYNDNFLPHHFLENHYENYLVPWEHIDELK